MDIEIVANNNIIFTQCWQQLFLNISHESITINSPFDNEGGTQLATNRNQAMKEDVSHFPTGARQLSPLLLRLPPRNGGTASRFTGQMPY